METSSFFLSPTGIVKWCTDVRTDHWPLAWYDFYVVCRRRTPPDWTLQPPHANGSSATARFGTSRYDFRSIPRFAIERHYLTPLYFIDTLEPTLTSTMAFNGLLATIAGFLSSDEEVPDSIPCKTDIVSLRDCVRGASLEVREVPC